MEVYVWQADHSSQIVFRKQIKLQKRWTITKKRFTLPAGCEQFGIRFYPPRAVTELWLDDVRLTPSITRQP